MNNFFVKGKELLKKDNILLRIGSVVLVCAMLLAIISIIPQSIEDSAASTVPTIGTSAYYEYRFAEALNDSDYGFIGTYSMPDGTQRAANGVVSAITSIPSVATQNTYTDYQGNTKNIEVGGPWMVEGLQAKYNAGTLSAPWDGTFTSVPTLGSGTIADPYLVYTAEQFVYCLRNDRSLKLCIDIDLAGYSGKAWSFSGNLSNAVFDGCGHTVYNYYRGGQMFNAGNTTVKNVSFCNSFATITGGSAMFIGSCSNTVIQNVVFNQVIAYAPGTGGAIVSGRGTPVTMENVLMYNSILYGYHCIAPFNAYNWADDSQNITLKNCINYNSITIAISSHSGGFVSCEHSNLYMENCFANVRVYSQNDGGGLCGYAHGVMHLKNCYCSGIVEGISGVGGVLANMEGDAECYNVYSTASVGAQGGMTNGGGFMGRGPNTAGSYENCYAAGEVGYLDLDVSSSKKLSIGAFTSLAFDNATATISNCYYDKQTTGMREWETGVTYEGGTGDIANLVGVLTKDSTKAGTGLTSSPGTTGFTGFTDNSEWVFSSGLYPQLAVFASATEASWYSDIDLSGYSAADQASIKSGWTDIINMIKAFSEASVNTVYLSTWDEGDYSGTALPSTTYDTVRDITAAASLSSSTNLADWKRVGDTNDSLNFKSTGAKTSIFGTVKDVLTLEDPATSDSGGWEIPQYAQGIDWIKVETKYGTQTGSRVLRLCPTSSLDVGSKFNSVDIEDYYDHADDVRMSYSTPAALAADRVRECSAESAVTSWDTSGSAEYLVDESDSTSWTATLKQLQSGKSAVASSTQSEEYAAGNVLTYDSTTQWRAASTAIGITAAKATGEYDADHSATKAIDGDTDTSWYGTDNKISLTGVVASSEVSSSYAAANVTDSDATNYWSSASSNLAYLKPVTASSVRDGDYSADYITDILYNYKYWYSSSTDTTPYVYVDLGADKTFDQYQINWWQSGSSYDLQVCPDGSDPTVEANWATLQDDATPTSSAITLDSAATGRYVRVLITKSYATQYVGISDLQITDTTTTMEDPWIYVDLGSNKSVTGVYLEQANYRSSISFDVYVCPNGSDPSLEASWTKATSYQQSIGSYRSVSFNTAFTARYVKIVATQGTVPFNLKTFSVYEAPKADSLYVDLGSQQAVETYMVNWTGYSVRYYSVQTCPDGSNPDLEASWTTVVSNKDYSTTQGAFPTGTTARYIRFLPTTVNKSSFTPVGISEVSIAALPLKPTIYIDLGSQSVFDILKISFSTDTAKKYDIQICSSANDPSIEASWSTILANQSANGVLSLPSGTAARYVRIKVTETANNVDPVGIYYIKVLNSEDMPWAYVNLGSVKNVNTVCVKWAGNAVGSYEIQTSTDALTWTTVSWQSATGSNDINFPSTSARYVRILPTSWSGNNQESVTINEIHVYATDDLGTIDAIYGVYPDDVLSSQSESMLDLGIYQNASALKALYATQEGTFENVNTGAMQRTSTDITSYPSGTTASANTINCEVRKVISVNGDGSYNLGSSLTTGATADADVMAKFSGNEVFEYTDKGTYQITYYWSLSDGRYMKDYKILTVGGDNPMLTVQVHHTDETENDAALYVDARSVDDTTDFGSSTKASDYALITKKTNAVAEWKKVESSVVVKKATLTLTDENGVEHSATVSNPTSGSVFTIPMKYYTKTTDPLTGDVLIYEHDVTRTFTIALSGGVYSVSFSGSDGVNNYYDDLDVDAVLTLYSDNCIVSAEATSSDGAVGYVSAGKALATLTSDSIIVNENSTTYVKWGAGTGSAFNGITISYAGGADQTLYLDDSQPTKVFTDSSFTTELANSSRSGNQIILSNITQAIHVKVDFVRTDIVVTLHIRQIVMDSDAKTGLGVPTSGYAQIQTYKPGTPDLNGSQFNKTINSGEETSAFNTVAYTDITYAVDSDYSGNIVSSVVPVNYKLKQITAKAGSADATTDVITDGKFSAGTDTEWYVTIWLEPSFSEPEPQYSQDTIINDMGKLSVQ